MIFSELRRWISSAFLKNTVWTFVGQAANRGLQFVLFLLLAKGLSVRDYGYLTVLLALMMSIADLVNAGFNATLVRYTARFRAEGRPDKVVDLFSTSFLNATVMGVVVIAALASVSPWLSRGFLDGRHGALLVLSGFGVVGTLYYALFAALFQGRETFRRLMVYNVGIASFRLLPVLVLYAARALTVETATLSLVAAPFLAAIVGLWMNRDLGIRIGRYDRALFAETMRFGRWMVLWAVVAVVQLRIDVYVLAPLAGAEQVSYFDVAQKFTQIIMMAFGAYATVLVPRLAKTVDVRQQRKEMRQAFVVSAGFAAVLSAAVVLFPPLLRAVFGGKYDASIPPLRIMLVGLIPYVFTAPFTVLLYAWGRSESFFFMALASLVVNVFASLMLVPRWGAVGSAVSFVLVQSVAWVTAMLLFFVFRRRHGMVALSDRDASGR